MTKHEHQWVKVSESENYYKFSCGLCNQVMRARKHYNSTEDKK